MYKLILCLLACLAVTANGLVGSTCKTEAECDAGECCQILSEIMVASKRQLGSDSPSEKTGICQVYKTMGQYCNGFEKINGYCGCGPGLRCHGRFEPLPSTDKRGLPYKPGYTYKSTCEAI